MRSRNVNGRAGHRDRRGNSTDRKRRKRYMLRRFGDGSGCPCTWCGKRLTYFTVTADRIEPGGSYRHENVIPACVRCNVQRGDVAVQEHALALARTR